MAEKSKKQAANREKKGDSENLFPVVGIGASAGGLDAFKTLVNAIPEDSGMAFVIVQHLDPDHESLLTDILQKETDIPVLEISEKFKIEPNHIYIMPSSKVMEVSGGKLRLAPRPAKEKHQRILPVDLLFSALAEVYLSHAIGVVLSGTASDGTKGLKAIKENGGITFAQDLETARHSGMPGNAVQAGVVDFVLPPDKIPEKLMEVTQIINVHSSSEESHVLDKEGVFSKIIALLRVRKGADFTYYKQSTIRRRILRRMAINKIKKVTGYLDHLRENKDEQNKLYQDFLIPVTSFFRDPNVFEQLSENFLLDFIKNIPADKPIRVWVAGCSTGEEAYSFAILLNELLDSHTVGNHEKKLQIFASDLSESAIEKARLGTYSESEVAGVSEQRLKRFFTKTNGRYQVNRQIRDTCVFAVHNFLKDPPFGKMDLISCRNVLIYFEPYLQKKALTTFHYVLNPNSLLLLGKSETTSGVPNLFSEVAKREKIYSRKDVPSKFMQVVNRRSELDFNDIEENIKPEKKSPDFESKADEIMLKKYTPAGVVVNEAMDIVQYRGKTSPFLEQSSGKPSHNLIALAAQGLAFELRNILHKAKQENENVKKENIPVKIDGELQSISIEAIPLPNTIEPYFLVLFHEKPTRDSNQTSETGLAESGKLPDSEKDRRIEQLEQELVETREDMRNITEDQEAAIEELQTANEELMSGSEELQSLNEELETSKEELQSTNEELVVLNQELNSLNEQVESERNYSESIVANIREPLLVLDSNLRIKTANHAFYKQFKLNEKETIGALIYNLGDKMWDFPELRKLLEDIIPEKPVIEDYEIIHSFPGLGKLHLLLNAREVEKDDESENLILLSLEDITEREKEKEKRRKIQERYTKELEEKIDERTAELKTANEELRTTNQELVDMNKELEAFTYISSHDLQEPLRKIQTFAGRILEKEDHNLSDKGKTYFGLMQCAAQRMQKLIDDLLTFSRLNTSERTFESVNLGTIVKEVLANLNEIIKEKKATVDIGHMCEADVIVFQFRQLMHNLINNALKFSRSGVDPHIKIESRTIKKGSKLKVEGLNPDKEYCQISVSDNGIGFEEKYSEKIFEVFQKLHGKDEYPGTGIGLATVKKIVTQHHGVIDVTSTLNVGTVFNIYIPLGN
ncbi:MAG: chemotaxis protein CheR [Bacteroidetes bacterium]|jgi:two-component system CheB/CheR fusion protein|nr:chemotaxis protein CheR [Bacteroidota bacterium]